MDSNKVIVKDVNIINDEIRYNDLNNSLELKIRDFCEREIKKQVEKIKKNLIMELIDCMKEEHYELSQSYIEPALDMSNSDYEAEKSD